MEIKRLFGLAIKQIRDDYGISQEKFALSIKMDRSYYASVEAGKRNISLVNMEKIAKGFNIPISFIFQRIEAIKLEDSDE